MQRVGLATSLSAIAAATLVLAACSPESNGERPTSVGANTNTVASSGRCQKAGLEMCYCDDGIRRGTQLCNPDGTFSECSCPGRTLQPGETIGASPIAPVAAEEPAERPLCMQL